MTDLRDLLALYHRDRGGSLAETEQGVRELSPMFNGLTPHRPGYLAAHRLRRAYVHYYLPVNAEKVARVLAELETYAPARGQPRVLDFGCGPGTASIALLLRRKVADLLLVDVVDEALDDAQWFARQLGVEARRAHEPPAGEKFDLILAANVLSETSASLEDSLSDRGHLVILEPALKTATRRLMEWRDRLTAKGYAIAAPCLRASTCPMLEHEDLWCHMDVAWPRPAAVAEIDRRVGLTKETLKYSYLVATRQGRTLSDRGGDVRVVSNLHKEKGKAWAWVCGRAGPLCRAEVLTRHRSDATAAFFRADRGDVLAMKVDGDFARSEGPIERIS
jgi:ribosomal protein RSM22 (predicted rRNA methylase)